MRLEDFADDRCDWCDRPYVPKDIRGRFCCRACGVQNQRAAEKAEWAAARRGYVCPVCNKPFEAGRSDQVYCGQVCASAARYARQRGGKTSAEARAELRCKVCHGPMPDAGSVQALYCHPCREKVFKAQDLASAKLRRAKVRAKMRCKVCSGPIPDARRTQVLYCESCRAKVRRDTWRAYRARLQRSRNR